MGGKTTKPVVQDSAAAVINEIEIHQAEIVNADLITILYIIALAHILQLIMFLFKIWRRNLKKKYLNRANSVEIL